MRPTLSTRDSSSGSPNHTSRSWLLRLHQGHERLKKSVHEGMRVPLPKWGQRVMGFVYFITPIVGGYYIMQWAIGKAHQSIGPNGEFLPNKDTPTGQYHHSSERPNYGVPLASSDEATQRKNQEKLQRFLKQQLKKPPSSAADS